MNPNPSSSKKTFILDTNVLLHAPQSIFKFEKDNTVVIPIEVLEELDRFKSTSGELGFNARAVHRSLRDMFNHGRPLKEMAVGSPDSPEAIEASSHTAETCRFLSISTSSPTARIRPASSA